MIEDLDSFDADFVFVWVMLDLAHNRQELGVLTHIASQQEVIHLKCTAITFTPML